MIQQLEKNDLLEKTNIIVTADHGMATMSKEKIITLDRVEDFLDLIDLDNSYGYDCNAGIAPKNDSVKELLYQVRNFQRNFEIFSFN